MRNPSSDGPTLLDREFIGNRLLEIADHSVQLLKAQPLFSCSRGATLEQPFDCDPRTELTFDRGRRGQSIEPRKLTSRGADTVEVGIGRFWELSRPARFLMPVVS